MLLVLSRLFVLHLEWLGADETSFNRAGLVLVLTSGGHSLAVCLAIGRLHDCLKLPGSG